MRQYEQAIFYTVWDKENNGVFLTSDSKNALKINPRPVFYEELNLFGFNELIPLNYLTSVSKCVIINVETRKKEEIT